MHHVTWPATTIIINNNNSSSSNNNNNNNNSTTLASVMQWRFSCQVVEGTCELWAHLFLTDRLQKLQLAIILQARALQQLRELRGSTRAAVETAEYELLDVQDHATEVRSANVLRFIDLLNHVLLGCGAL